MKSLSDKGWNRAFLAATFAALLVRLALLGAYPLMDTSEARYGAIARIMAHTGDWITPWFEPDVPFWGKPPLAFWLSALSIDAFGAGEWAIRLPSLLLSAATVWLVVGIARAAGSPSPWRAGFIAATSLVFVLTSGAVLTDPALMFATTLAFASAWHVLVAGDARWRWVLFVGLALGALAKGPIALVLTLGPLAAWAVWCGGFGGIARLWQAFPWLRGLALFAVLVLPWYVLAERKTPGFVQYFIVGEHWSRFVDPGWKGDRYGNAHQSFRGAVWLQGFAAWMPWSLALVALPFLARRGRGATTRQREDRRFVLLWALGPMLLFTPAGNVIYTYVLPAVPAFALLLEQLLVRSRLDLSRWTLVAGTAMPLAFAVTVAYWNLFPERVKSEQRVLAALDADRRQWPLLYVDERPFSARFYSGERAQRVPWSALDATIERLAPGSKVVVAVPRARLDAFRAAYARAQPLGGNPRFELFELSRRADARR